MTPGPGDRRGREARIETISKGFSSTRQCVVVVVMGENGENKTKMKVAARTLVRTTVTAQHPASCIQHLPSEKARCTAQRSTAQQRTVADRNTHATAQAGPRSLSTCWGQRLELYSLQTGVRGDMDTPQAIGKPRIRERLVHSREGTAGEVGQCPSAVS